MTTSTAAATPHQWLTNYPPGVDWYQSFKSEPVFKLLDDTVQRFPTAPALNFFGKHHTYAELAALVDKATAGLRSLGVTKGTKVGLFLPNSPTFVVYYFAILKAGGTVVNFNPLYTLEELTFQVKDSDTELMITLDLAVLFGKVEGLMKAGTLKRAVVCSFTALLPTTKSVLYRLFKAKDLIDVTKSAVADRVVLEGQFASIDGRPVAIDIDPDRDIAVLQYTGGTTGTPKGAMLTHANLTINVQQIVAWSQTVEDGKERMMGVLPFFHVFAMTGVMNLSIAKAAEIIIMPRFVLADALKLITRYKPTMMPGVPTLFNAIMNHPQIRKYDLKSLKLCLSGGAPLPLEVRRGFEKMTGCSLIEAYGLSETSPGATMNPSGGPVKEGSIGQPIPGTIVSLRSLDDPTREVPLGERGEICIAGPQVMAGYWKRPDETERTFTGKFLRTGDVGVMDRDGFIFIVDRIKDLIICGGYNVYPRRIEEALYEHPAVEEVTVIGIPDSYRGEAPKAFIKLKAGQSATKEDMLRHLEPKISKIEMPAEIEFRDSLPKTMIGKLSKKELKAEEAAKRQSTG